MGKINSKYLTLIFIIISIAIFFTSNIIQINWINDEILWQGFFWSMSSPTDFNLQTGIHASDILKPFNIYHADGTFRARQVSYFTEMLSFKFWQNFELVLTNNFTITLIHLINSILAGYLVFLLANNIYCSIITLFLTLNCGVGLATILYPFRNAKLLVTTWFLVNFILIAKNKLSFSKYPLKTTIAFFSILLLSSFTDEIFLFLSVILFGYIFLKDGFASIKSKNLLIGLFTTICIFAALYISFYNISTKTIDPQAHTGEQVTFLKNLPHYIFNIQTYKDINKAFFGYFLRRNFGYWGFDILGVLSFISFFGLAIFSLVNFKKDSNLKVILLILFVITSKAILFPHNAGYHNILMPEGTFFPSLFFFSYYYIYCEAILFCIIVGLLTKDIASNKKFYLFIILSILTISISNLYHLKNGPQEVLKFMKFDKDNPEKPQSIVKRIEKIKLIKTKNTTPIYISFPNSTDVIKARRNDPFVNLYARMIPILYLKSFENGALISDFKNLPHPAENNEPKLLSAKTYYDVMTEDIYDISKLNLKENSNKFVIINKGQIKTIPLFANNDTKEIIFFVKGYAGFLLHINGEKIEEGQQVYGETFKMLRINTQSLSTQIKKNLLALSIAAISEKAELIGPFLVKE